jgi:hypothetical protein
MLHFERRHEPLLPQHLFLRRLGRHILLAVAIIGGSLAVGVIGYHTIEGWTWLDSLLEASMILSGMGPIQNLHTSAGKLFASFYAIYSGVALLTTIGILFAPIFHRFLHHFHLEHGKRE